MPRFSRKTSEKKVPEEVISSDMNISDAEDNSGGEDSDTNENHASQENSDIEDGREYVMDTDMVSTINAIVNFV